MYVKRYVTTKWCIETLQSMDRESRIPDVTDWEFVGAFPQG